MPLVDRIAAVFDEILGVPKDRFALDLAPESVPNWDSVGHMSLVARLEREFEIQFEVDEIMEMSSPQRIVEIVAGRQGGA